MEHLLRMLTGQALCASNPREVLPGQESLEVGLLAREPPADPTKKALELEQPFRVALH